MFFIRRLVTAFCVGRHGIIDFHSGRRLLLPHLLRASFVDECIQNVHVDDGSTRAAQPHDAQCEHRLAHARHDYVRDELLDGIKVLHACQVGDGVARQRQLQCQLCNLLITRRHHFRQTSIRLIYESQCSIVLPLNVVHVCTVFARQLGQILAR